MNKEFLKQYKKGKEDLEKINNSIESLKKEKEDKKEKVIGSYDKKIRELENEKKIL